MLHWCHLSDCHMQGLEGGCLRGLHHTRPPSPESKRSQGINLSLSHYDILFLEIRRPLISQQTNSRHAGRHCIDVLNIYSHLGLFPFLFCSVGNLAWSLVHVGQVLYQWAVPQPYS